VSRHLAIAPASLKAKDGALNNPQVGHFTQRVNQGFREAIAKVLGILSCT
jgi:hypothetical protein